MQNNKLVFSTAVFLLLSWNLLSAADAYNIATVSGVEYKNIMLVAFEQDVLTITTTDGTTNIELGRIDKIWLPAATHKKVIAPQVVICASIGALYTGYYGLQQLDDWFDFDLKDTNEKNFVPVGMWLILSSAPGTVVGYMVGTMIGSLSAEKYNISDFQKLDISQQRKFIESLMR